VSDSAQIVRARRAAETVARQSYGRLVAYLAARTKDVTAAEDALAEAFTSALSQWPVSGVPDHPEAWLLTVARRRHIDTGRHLAVVDASQEDFAMIDEARRINERHDIPDERMRLMFACAHPAIDATMRAPLMLQTVLGLDAGAIASAFLIPPATMGQRLVRAKQRIRDTGIPFRIPDRAELPERLDAVLLAIYAAYTHGWVDTETAAHSPDSLASEAIWLARVVISLMPDEPEARGLLALMLYGEARRPARRDELERYVPLADQDTDLWDAKMIDEAEQALLVASTAGPSGRFQIEAAIQSVHCARKLAGHTDWPSILALYDILTRISSSPVVAVNRAIAIAEIDGPAAALAELNRVGEDQRLDAYQPYWATRANLLARAERWTEVAGAYRRAISLAQDDAVKDYLLFRLRELPVAATH
jgi:RNA polymerase sigma-70 factor (ECF subfamily)